jgi:hypothetical protein
VREPRSPSTAVAPPDVLLVGVTWLRSKSWEEWRGFGIRDLRVLFYFSLIYNLAEIFWTVLFLLHTLFIFYAISS